MVSGWPGALSRRRSTLNRILFMAQYSFNWGTKWLLNQAANSSCINPSLGIGFPDYGQSTWFNFLTGPRSLKMVHCKWFKFKVPWSVGTNQKSQLIFSNLESRHRFFLFCNIGSVGILFQNRAVLSTLNVCSCKYFSFNDYCQKFGKFTCCICTCWLTCDFDAV